MGHSSLGYDNSTYHAVIILCLHLSQHHLADIIIPVCLILHRASWLSQRSTVQKYYLLDDAWEYLVY
jgi:hypothetical protein